MRGVRVFACVFAFAFAFGMRVLQPAKACSSRVPTSGSVLRMQCGSHCSSPVSNCRYQTAVNILMIELYMALHGRMGS